MKTHLAAGSLALLLLAPLAGCGSDDGGGASPGSTGTGSVAVEASFYPLQWLAEQVGGADVDVASLTPPGAEPHDIELTPKQVGRISDADLVIKIDGFQPAVDEAAGDGGNVFDAADAVDLDLTGEDHDHDHEDGHDHEAEAAHEDEAGHEGEAEEHHDDGEVRDPHFWLDPTMLAAAAPALADRLAELDPDHAEAYRQRADRTVDLLTAIDEDFADGLASCQSTELVTSHEAFGYLARRYGFTQLGINGLSAEQEPSPSRLAEVADFVDEHGVNTIYFETLVPSDIAQTIADETGADTAVLDPIEGVTDESAGDDYPSIMAANLEALRQGQSCT